MEKMDPRDDRTSIIRAEFMNCLDNQLKSKSVSSAPPPPVPPVANVSNNNNGSSAVMPGSSPDTEPTSSLPQLPPLSFSAIGTSIPNSVQPRQRLSSITERSNSVIHDRALSFISPSTTNSLATEKNGQHQRQPSLDTKMHPAIPSEANAAPSPSHSSEPPMPIPTTAPSTLMVDAKIDSPPLTLDTSSTVTPVTNPQPHHSPTTTLSILTNPHHSPTQSVFTNPHQGSEHSDSPTTINHSSLPPLRDLANPTSPTPHSAGSNQAKTVRSPLRTSIDNVQESSTSDSSLDKDTVTDDEQDIKTPTEAARGVANGNVVISSAQRNATISAATWKSSINPSASSRVVGRLSPTRSGLGRKPSGARAQLTPRSYNRVGPESFSSQTLTEEEEESMSDHQDQDNNKNISYDDEALAALTYLNMTDSPTSATPPSPPQHRSPIIITPPSAERPKFQLSDGPPNPPAVSSSDSVPFRSSFAPSSKVAERIMKVQAQQAAQEAAKHRPGRANGKRKAKTVPTGSWGESSDEEEDEEEEEDDDVDSDPEVPMRGPQSTSSQQGFSSSSSSKPHQSSQLGTDSNAGGRPSHLRPPRHLPVPPSRPGKCYDLVHCGYVLSNPRTLLLLYPRGRTLSAISPDDY